MARADMVRDLQSRLENRANPKTRAWWEGYLKHAASFRGVKMADVRLVLHEWHASVMDGGYLSATEQKELAFALFEQEYSEDKIAGILFLQEILLPAGAVEWRTDLERFADLFGQGWIDDWNVCDWFCVKVLGPLVEQEGEACARAVSGWRTADNLWQRRASGVAFINLAKRGDENFPGFTGMLLTVCEATVQHSERFSQTGTGWVLRELSVAEPQRVEAFIRDHICEFSSEGLRYAAEKLPPAVKESVRSLRRQCKPAS
jgi:3-methyladenine DNA glycosylase AlkD